MLLTDTYTYCFWYYRLQCFPKQWVYTAPFFYGTVCVLDASDGSVFKMYAHVMQCSNRIFIFDIPLCYINYNIVVNYHQCRFLYIYNLLTVHLGIFISVINQLDEQNFCFTICLSHASTCFEHMCSKHVEAWNKLIVKQKFLCIKLVNYWDK